MAILAAGIMQSCVDREDPAMPKGYSGNLPNQGQTNNNQDNNDASNGSNNPDAPIQTSLTIGGAPFSCNPGTKIPLTANLIPVLPGNIIKEFKADGQAKPIGDILPATDGAKITASMVPTSQLTIEQAQTVLSQCKPHDIINLEVSDLTEKNIADLAEAIKNTKAKVNLVITEGSIQMVGDKTFMGCNQLTSVILPAGLEVVGPSAFQDCKNLAHVAFCAAASTAKAKAESYFGSQDEDFAAAQKEIFQKMQLSDTEYSLLWLRPALNIAAIDGHYYIIEANGSKPAFSDIYYGNGVWWRDNVMSEPLNPSTISASTYNTSPRHAEKLAIFANAFKGCESLAVISLPRNVSDIAAGAFAGCTKLSFVDISNPQINIFADSFESIAENALAQLPESINDAALDNFKTTFGEKNVVRK